MAKHDVSHFQTILLIDTTSKDETRLGLITKPETVTLERPVRAQELQRLIDELLGETDTTLGDIDAVTALTGPGSFTGARIGITAANTLGWLYKIPLIPLEGSDFETALAELQRRRAPKVERVIRPTA